MQTLSQKENQQPRKQDVSNAKIQHM